MKLVLYILCIIAVLLFSIWGIQNTDKLCKQINTQRDSTAYWKGRYDSVELKADTFAHLVIELSCTKDSAIMDEGYMHKDWTRDMFSHLALSLKWANSLHTSIRHSRHRKDTSIFSKDFYKSEFAKKEQALFISLYDTLLKYRHCIKIDSVMINDEKGTNGMPPSNFDTTVHH